MEINLTNVNLYNGFRGDRHLSYIEGQKLKGKGIEWLIEQVKSLPDDIKVAEFPSYNGRLLRLLEDRIGLDKFSDYYAYERRRRLFDAMDSSIDAQNVLKFKISPIIGDNFKPKEFDLFLSVDHVISELNPVTWINQVLSKVLAKNIFIYFPIIHPKQSSDLKDQNARIIELFPNGRYIENFYNNEALTEIASQTGLELKIIRDYDGDSAILYRLDKSAVKPKSEPVEEEIEIPKDIPEEKPKPKKRRKAKKSD